MFRVVEHSYQNDFLHQKLAFLYAYEELVK